MTPMQPTAPDRGAEPETRDADDAALLLRRWRNGDRDAFDQLIAGAYADLRKRARRLLARERDPDLTLQTTALVSEAWLRLAGSGRHGDWRDRAHFLAGAARVMRQVLVDAARRRHAAKRPRWTLRDAEDVSTPGPGLDLIALDQALERLAAFSADKAALVELRYFGGLPFDEISEMLGRSRASLDRDWRVARAFLLDALGDEERDR
jgi:RNA polymerase sigma factor (TIGR02999 family)